MKEHERFGDTLATHSTPTSVYQHCSCVICVTCNTMLIIRDSGRNIIETTMCMDLTPPHGARRSRILNCTTITQLSRFRSRWPSVKINKESYYTWILGQDIFSADHPFTINGQTGHVVTRGELWKESRRLAYGFRNARAVGLNTLDKGATAMTVSQATDIYMVVQFALVSCFARQAVHD